MRDGYVECPWLMPLRNKSCESFARRLVEETGCLIVDYRRIVSVDEFELEACELPLSEHDRLLLRDAVYQPNTKPSYESVKSCLVWPDEVPDGLSADGRTTIFRLLAARSYMHRGIPLIGRLERLASVWKEAVASGLEWNGFRRTSISEADQSFLAKSIREEGEAGVI
jgi:hypothetical protein